MIGPVGEMDGAEAFRAEAAELLDGLEQELLDLNMALDDRARIDAVFRVLHTLKGSGAMFGFEALASFTHHCESAFDKVRKREAQATPELVALILSARDHMRALVEDAGSADSGHGNALISQIADALAMPAPAGQPELSGIAEAAWQLRFRLPIDAMQRGTNPLLLLDELRELGASAITACADGIPDLDAFDPAACYLGWDAELPGGVSREAIEDVFLFLLDDMELSMERKPDAAQPEPLPAKSDLPAEQDAPGPAAPEPGRTSAPEARRSENVRVPAERLDELMDRVGELVIAQSRLSQVAHGDGSVALRSISEEMERLVGELRDTMMVLRMIPVSSLFGRFRRLVHDLAAETGKQIALVTEGEATEVDKTVIELLFDPLVHIVRNSCDHGLETVADRLEAGKPATGTVVLSAEQSGGEVVITVRDDGRGISRERVRAKAEANGLVAPDQPLADRDLFDLIFHPGFSTAAQVTSLSGRGVGMDVVKRAIEGLRGSIEVASPPGSGTSITLRIPLTLAIIDGLLVRVGDTALVIPLASVEECIELSLEDDLRSRGRSLITLREQLIPFLRLRELFETGTRPDPHQKVVVVSAAGARVGLVVDQIVGSHQTVIKPLSRLHRNIAAFSGATILGDGSVALILDPGQLIAMGQSGEDQHRAAV